MAHTFAQLQEQIAALEAEAQRVRRAEVSTVIAKIREAVAAYGITAADIFAGNSANRGKAKGGKRAAAIKYADDQGNTWVGMGKRPQWLRDALDSGKSLEDFAVTGATQKSARAATSSKKAFAKKGRKGAGKMKFKDSAGHSWTGFGPKPGWLKDAIAGGKTLEEFRV